MTNGSNRRSQRQQILFFCVPYPLGKDLKTLGKCLVLDHLASVLIDEPKSKYKGHGSIQIMIQNASIIEELVRISLKPGGRTRLLLADAHRGAVQPQPLTETVPQKQ